MAKIPHDALHQLFRDDPTLFTQTMTKVLGIDFPKTHSVSYLDTDLTEIKNIERRADTILLAETADGPHAVIIEAQTSPDDDKWRSWAWYVAYLFNDLEVPVTLLVLTPKEETARWARKPHKVGLEDSPTMVVQPIVVGPRNVKPLRDVETARRDVPYSVFTSLVRRLGDDAEQNLSVLAEALNGIDVQTAVFWAEYTEAGLGKGCIQQFWRKIMDTMSYPYVSETRRKGIEVGREEGRLEAEIDFVLSALENRGIELNEADRARVTSCEDSDLLRTWFDRSFHATSAEDVFGAK